MSVPGDKLPSPALADHLRRRVSRLCRTWGFSEAGCGTKTRLLAFLGRAMLVRSGLAGGRVLVMNCEEGRHTDGFYAQFTVILGLLEHFERWPDLVAGVRVDFGKWPLYYDAPYGGNPWEYYFHPIDLGGGSGSPERAVDFHQGNRFAMRGEMMPRRKAHALIRRYVRVKPHIRYKVDRFVKAHFAGSHVIGVHYRGTDKWQEAPRVSYDTAVAAAHKAVAAAGAERCRLFVASDEQAFVDRMAREFPGRVASWHTLRSTDGSPIDFREGDNYRQGEDAVIDCLLLSRCNRLIRTASTLSLCSGYFNPDLPIILLNRPY